MEKDSGKFDVCTLYKAIRQIESTGVTNIGMSYVNLERPAQRQPGDRDHFEVKITSEMDYVLTQPSTTRESLMSKTVFSVGLTRATFPTAALTVAQRFRYVSIGRNLKPVKPYIVTRRAIALQAKKPKLV